MSPAERRTTLASSPNSEGEVCRCPALRKRRRSATGQSGTRHARLQSARGASMTPRQRCGLHSRTRPFAKAVTAGTHGVLMGGLLASAVGGRAACDAIGQGAARAPLASLVRGRASLVAASGCGGQAATALLTAEPAACSAIPPSAVRAAGKGRHSGTQTSPPLSMAAPALSMMSACHGLLLVRAAVHARQPSTRLARGWHARCRGREDACADATVKEPWSVGRRVGGARHPSTSNNADRQQDQLGARPRSNRPAGGHTGHG